MGWVQAVKNCEPLECRDDSWEKKQLSPQNAREILRNLWKFREIYRNPQKSRDIHRIPVDFSWFKKEIAQEAFRWSLTLVSKILAPGMHPRGWPLGVGLGLVEDQLIQLLLVGGLGHFLFFPYIVNRNPNWLFFSEGLKPPTRLVWAHIYSFTA